MEPGKIAELLVKDSDNSGEKHTSTTERFQLGLTSSQASSLRSVTMVECCMLKNLIQLRDNSIEPKEEAKRSLHSRNGN